MKKRPKALIAAPARRWLAAGIAFLALLAPLAAGVRRTADNPRRAVGTDAPGESVVTIGTFNVENFTMKDARAKGYYTPGDAAGVARSILASGADVLALQEIEGDATMKRFVRGYLPGWDYAGNDTGGTQDLYFIWNARKIELAGVPVPYEGNKSFTFAGKRAKRFDRPPLRAVFREKASGRAFSMIDVHLKSKLVFGSRDRELAQRRNTAKRDAQTESLNGLRRRFSGDGPLFILGDFNDEYSLPRNGKKLAFPVLWLKSGYSYDNMKENLDYIGYAGIGASRLGPARETETAIPRRAKRGKQHPDHDIVAVDVRLP